jgi:Glycosyl transferase family 2
VIPPQLAAVLIVRDEADRLPECLASLDGIVDEIVVHDTGSRDCTVAIARAAGAVVHEGFWDDDFARARNVGLELARAPWVLVLDADERVSADPPVDPVALRELLAGTPADVLTVEVRNAYPEELGGAYRHPGPRLLRRSAVRYAGRVHEQPVAASGSPPAGCPPRLLVLDHLGYADAEVARAKARRNAAIAGEELARLAGTGGSPGDEVAKLMLDLGRSLVVCGQPERAADTFESLRAMFPRARRAVEATDALARLLLAAGRDDAVLGLAEELREAGTDGRYCDWLRAQALAQLGGVEEALHLLRHIDVLRDSARRELDVSQVFEMRALVATLAGRTDEAAHCLATAMVLGRTRGRGGLLLDLCRRRTADEVAALLLDRERAQPPGSAHRAAVAAELAGCRPPGPAVAGALAPAAMAPGALAPAAVPTSASSVAQAGR